MATQELVELQKIAKLLKKQIEPTLAKVKRAKKIKLKDLLKPENINERINNFLDKLTVDDAIKGSAFLLLATLIYPFVYNLKHTIQRRGYRIRLWMFRSIDRNILYFHLPGRKYRRYR